MKKIRKRCKSFMFCSILIAVFVLSCTNNNLSKPNKKPEDTKKSIEVESLSVCDENVDIKMKSLYVVIASDKDKVEKAHVVISFKGDDKDLLKNALVVQEISSINNGETKESFYCRDRKI